MLLYFFLKSDINAFNSYRYLIDNEIKNTQVEFFNLSFEKLMERMAQVEGFYKSLLETPFDFSIKDEIGLFESLNIDVLVIKNVGGKGSFAKVEAARALNILVLMIDRPQKSNTLVISSIPEIFKWVDTNL